MREVDELTRQGIEAELERGDLQSLSGTHTTAWCDGPYEVLSFQEYAVRVVSVCPGGVDSPDREAAGQLLGRVAAAFGGCGTDAWTRVDGDVRYNLVRTEPDAYPNGELTWFRRARPWPMGDPEAVARDDGDPGLSDPAEARVAAGEDANQLRELLDAYLTGEIGSQGDEFVPIEQPDGARYLLYVRDTIPLEDEYGRLPFE